MVKYIHCERCKTIINTESWIGEVHVYEGVCSSCLDNAQQENKIEQKLEAQTLTDHLDAENTQKIENSGKSVKQSIADDKILLSNLQQKTNELLSGKGSIHVLIKEINDDLIFKAKERVDKTYESFDVNKVEAENIIRNTENILDSLSEYWDYIDRLINILKIKPKIKIKSALSKVYKESMENLPKMGAKVMIKDKKSTLKMVSNKAVEIYKLYSEIEDVSKLTKKMALHPFNEIQEHLSKLPFYNL